MYSLSLAQLDDHCVNVGLEVSDRSDTVLSNSDTGLGLGLVVLSGIDLMAYPSCIIQILKVAQQGCADLVGECKMRHADRTFPAARHF